MITETNGRRPAAAVGGRGETQPGAGDEGAVARRVARNSLLPFAAGMAGRVLALALAMVMARTLGASGSGLYAVAVNLWLYASIVVDFGLGTWLTREVARRPEGARDTVADALGLRLGLAVCALPLLLLAALGAGFVQGSGPDAVLLMTVALLGMGLLPGAVSAAGTSLFYAFEDMTFPALVQLGTAALTTLGGAALLLAGFDVVALAWVSLAVNLLTAAVFTVACARRYVPLRASLHPAAPAGPGPGGPAPDAEQPPQQRLLPLRRAGAAEQGDGGGRLLRQRLQGDRHRRGHPLQLRPGPLPPPRPAGGG